MCFDWYNHTYCNTNSYYACANAVIIDYKSPNQVAMKMTYAQSVLVSYVSITYENAFSQVLKALCALVTLEE